jgi:flagellar biosynthesis/type III secretory pathway chaperone
MSSAASLQALLATVVAEEAALVSLVRLAGEEQRALVRSDFPRIEAVSDEMTTVARQLERLEHTREAQLTEAGMSGASLADVTQVAASFGIEGFGMARERLGARAAELRAMQEQNARLILAASRLRERWLKLLAGMVSDTYAVGGRQELTQGRRVVSRTA